jgi:acyl carrier protein
MELQDALLRYIRDHLAEEPEQIESPDQQLITSGLLDSLCLVELQAYVDEDWGIRVPDEFVTVANFNTVASMAASIARHGCPREGA